MCCPPNAASCTSKHFGLGFGAEGRNEKLTAGRLPAGSTPFVPKHLPAIICRPMVISHHSRPFDCLIEEVELLSLAAGSV